MKRSRIVALVGAAAVIAAGGAVAFASTSGRPVSCTRTVSRGHYTITCPEPVRTRTKTVTKTKTKTKTRTVTRTKTVTPTPPPTTSTPAGWQCTTSEFHGRCGLYGNYPGVSGTPTDPFVDQNVWGPISGETQTLYANSPGDWQVVNNTAAGNTAVTAYPNTGAAFNEAPLSSYSSLTSSFAETMPRTSGISAWHAYDVWFDDWAYEMMIQVDFVGNGPCDYIATATFGGSNGVPSQLWGLCKYGSELIWKLAEPGSTVGSSGTVSESTGSVDIKAMAEWLADHGYMPAGPNVTSLSDGWEIASTGGQPEKFTMTNFTLTAR